MLHLLQDNHRGRPKSTFALHSHFHRTAFTANRLHGLREPQSGPPQGGA